MAAKYWTPDYSGHFACKAGGCKMSCCSGWRIELRREEYERLRALEQNAALAQRLQGALALCADGARAVFVRTERGDCPLLRRDGLCALQAECGEEALPAVCREYPRSVRADYACEVAFSASCEAVAELLFAAQEPLGFVQREWPQGEPCGDGALRRTVLLRTAFMRLLQRREVSLPERMAQLAALLQRLQECEEAGGAAGLRRELARWSGDRKGRPYEQEPAREEEFMPRQFCAPAPDWVHLAAPLALCGAFFAGREPYGTLWEHLTRALGLPEERADWSEEALARAAHAYAALKERFERSHPLWQAHWERLMANYAFYARVPVSGRLAGLREEALVFSACYALTKFAAVCCAQEGEPSSVVARVMRLTEHSGFDRRCAELMREGSFGAPERLRDMLLFV
ncbi:MAG: flagellin lysine-N-methylase [Eubacteriales bacterium]|nr:flagellin lysine-N-methylase [Eubacteriales bacterium]